MGNKYSLSPSIPQLDSTEWRESSFVAQQNTDYGFYRTLTNLQTNKLIDQYQIFFNDEQDYHFYLDSFLWRMKQPNIVQTLFLKETHIKELCSQTYAAKVYIEHIDTRMSDITDIPYPQNLYVALCALQGYQGIYNNLHYFRVEQNQICVDERGEVRVWLNSDLSKNFPALDHSNENGDQGLMVEQIMRIITQNTDQQQEPQPLMEFFESYGENIGFDKAKIIIQEYAQKHNVQIPECFQSILEVYRRNQNNSSQVQQDCPSRLNEEWHDDHKAPNSPEFVQPKSLNSSYKQPLIVQSHTDLNINKVYAERQSHKQNYNHHSQQKLHQTSLKECQNVKSCQYVGINPSKPLSAYFGFEMFNQRSPLGFQPQYTLISKPVIFIKKPSYAVFPKQFISSNNVTKLQSFEREKKQDRESEQKRQQQNSYQYQSSYQQERSVEQEEISNKQPQQIQKGKIFQKPNYEPQKITSILKSSNKSSKLSNINWQSQKININKLTKFKQQIPQAEAKLESQNFKSSCKVSINQQNVNSNNTALRTEITNCFEKVQKQADLKGNNSKKRTVYFTADTEEELDPQIAADLQKLYSQC